MAIGDKNDVFNRLKSAIPKWFGDSSQTLDAVLQGFSTASSFIYSLYAYTKLQTRIKTATDGWLDIIAGDFFGSRIARASNQSDASFRANILANLIRERATRNSIVKVLTDLTGRAPIIYEPMRPLDTKAYGFACGYGVAGAYGSMLMPYQALITAFRPVGTGIPYVAGYGTSPAGYSQPSRADYASINQIQQSILDKDIYAAIDSCDPAAVISWTKIIS